MSCNCTYCYSNVNLPSSNIEIPLRFPQSMQRWMPTLQQPYPMNFTQAASPEHQLLVQYAGKPRLQGLSPILGPTMFPLYEYDAYPVNAWERKHTIYNPNNKIAYPTTHSIPGPYLQSYISLPRKVYAY